MKKVINFIQKNIFGFLIGVLFCSITIVLADTINSNEVLYDNSNSATTSDNVQDVLDDMYRLIGHSSLGYSLLTHNPTGLSTGLIAGLYRYQGEQNANNTVDNYICFGTTNKNTCTSNMDKYMYRIIGINETGQMKLMKKEGLSYQFNSTTGVDWVHSDLYNGLNGNYFLENTTYIPDSSWSDRINTSVWHYLTTTDTTIETLADRELGSSETVNAKIGLIYLHDYAYTLENPAFYDTSWMHISKNDPNMLVYEWTISRYNANWEWSITRYGGLSYDHMADQRCVRPVFFLNSNERIASGNGTITDPYILS